MENRVKGAQLLSTETFLLLHFLICSLVLLKVSLVLGWVIYSHLPVGVAAATLNDFFIEFSYFPRKPSELLGYALAILFLSLYYLLSYFLLSQFAAGYSSNFIKTVIASKALTIGYFITLLVLTVALLIATEFETSSIGFIFAIGFWLTLLLMPVSGLVIKGLDAITGVVSGRSTKRLQIFLLALLSAQMLTVFLPYIFGTLKIPNDYMDIPGKTLLGNRYVDNTEYINERQIGGLLKYSPIRDQGRTPTPRPDTFALLTKTPVLVDFIERHEPFPLFTILHNRRVPDELADFYAKAKRSRETRYHYNDELGALVLNGRMTTEEKEELDRIVNGEAEKAQVNTLFFASSFNDSSFSKRMYSAEELDFLRKNRRELTAQSKAGWFFHHHSHMFVPINEYALGKPVKELNAQYGKWNAVVLRHLSEAMGGVNFQNYFRALYLFYPIYLAISVIILLLILKDIRFVLLGAVSIFGAFLLISEELLFIAPGFNPIRHFFDLPVILAFYLYVTQTKNSLRFLVLALMGGVLGILASAEFGVILMLALLLSASVYIIGSKRVSIASILVLVVAAASAMVAVVHGSAGDNPMLLYYVLGVSAPSIETSRLLLILGLFSALYLFAIKVWPFKSPLKHLFLFLFLYTQGMVIYYVWHPGIHHLLALAPMWVLMVLVMLKIAVGAFGLERSSRHILVATGFAVAVFLYLPSLAWFYLARMDDASSFEAHKIFSWRFPSASFDSTMDPAYFADSIRIVRKYSDQNAIHIISKYDNFIPFLAQKYSAMPFVELATSLVSQKEIDRAASAIRDDKPEFIYVDTDIERNLNGDIYSEWDPIARSWGIYSESFARAKVLNLQKKVFFAIRAQYEPIEKGLLITAYRRKS